MKNYKKIFFFVLVFPLLTTSAFSENFNFFFSHINNNNGLSQNSVYSILQDDEGYLWFATEDGLNRYDGYSFKIYNHDTKDVNSISNDRIRVIFKDSKGNIWVGTNGGGLNKYLRDVDKFIRYLPDPENPESEENKIFSIYETKRGVLWVGSYGGGLYSFDREKTKFKIFKLNIEHSSNLKRSIYSIIEDSWEELWIGTAIGLYKYDKKNKKF